MEIYAPAKSSSSSPTPGDDGGGGQQIRVKVHLFRVRVRRCPPDLEGGWGGGEPAVGSRGGGWWVRFVEGGDDQNG